tara:strand:- start:124 stop:1074 length:951 start_codon:yes stop_codon:yes gene_type:complete
MGFIAILQEFSSNEIWGSTQYILWFIESNNRNPWGTFMYRNQGGAYLILALVTSGFLYFYFLNRAMLSNKIGGPYLLCFLLIVTLAGSIWLSLSRSSIILGLGITAVFVIMAFCKSLSSMYVGGSRSIPIIFFILIILGGTQFAISTNWRSVEIRLKKLETQIVNIESDKRYLSAIATWDMSKDRLQYGWGAGSFSYIFPIYQVNYENIWYDSYYKKRLVYRHAHNDWLQFLSEYGIVGCSILGLLFASLIGSILINSKISLVGVSFLCFGISVIFLNNAFDFIFSSPAYWVAFWGSMILVSKLLSLEAKLHKKEV